MGDTFQKTTAVLTATSLTDDKTMIEQLKTAQFSVQAFDSSGDPVVISGGTSTVTITPRPVGNPSGNGQAAISIDLNTPTVQVLENRYLESVGISLNSIPSGAEEVHVTIFQSIY